MALPGVDPVTTMLRDGPAVRPLRGLDLALRVLLDRRSARADRRPLARRDASGLRRLGAARSTGRRSQTGYVRWEDGRIVEVGAGRAERHYARRGDPARASSTRTRTSSTRCTPASATARRSARWLRDPHRAQAPARRATTWSRSPAAAPPSRSPPGSRRRPTTASRAPPRPPRTSSGCARSSTSRCSAATRPRRERRFDEKRARVEETRARADRHLAARALHLLARGLPLVPLARHPRRDASRRERRRERVARARHRPARGGSATSSSRRRASGPSATLERGARPRPALRALRRRSTTTRSRCSPSADVPVAHCPRSNALLGCGVAPLAALRAAGVRVGLGTDSPASTPSFDVVRGAARRRLPPRGRASGAPTRCTRPTRCGSLRSTQPAPCGLDDEVGSLTPGKRADLTVVSLAGSPYDPG